MKVIIPILLGVSAFFIVSQFLKPKVKPEPKIDIEKLKRQFEEMKAKQGEKKADSWLKSVLEGLAGASQFYTAIKGKKGG